MLQGSLELGEKWVFSEAEHQLNMAFVTQLLGELYLDKDIDVAGDWLVQSLTHYRTLGDKWGIAQVYCHQGNVQRMLANYDAANDLLKKSNNLYRELGDIRSRINVLEVLSTNSRYSGHPEQAMLFSQECYELAEQINDKASIAKALNSLAFSYGTGLGNYVQAVPLQERCVAIYQDLGDLSNSAIQGARLGMLHSATGSFQKGQQLLQKNIVLLRQTNLQKWLGWSCQMLGITLLARQKPHEARHWLLEAESIYDSFGTLDEPLYSRPYLIFLERVNRKKEETHQALIDLQTIVYKHRLYYPQLILFKVITAILSEQALTENNIQGTCARLAIELAGLSNRYPSASNQMFVKQTIDKPTDELISQVPKELAKKHIAKGRELDVWETAEALLQELTELGWGEPE